jgi:hypothetical protein
VNVNLLACAFDFDDGARVEFLMWVTGVLMAIIVIHAIAQRER